MTNKTRKLTESAMLIAVAVVLELIAKMFIPELPFGGQITLCSMLPVVLISYRHGVKWGLISGLGYAMVEMAIGTKTLMAAFQPGYFGEGTLILNALVMCLLDYVLAFSMLGLGGVLRNRVENRGLSLALGALIALGARYLCHVLSGYILFSDYAAWFFTQEGFPAWGASVVEALSPQLLGFVYSLVYNAMYMIPEMGITFLCALLLARVPRVVTKVS